MFEFAEFANKIATKRRMGSFRKSIAGRSSDKQVNDALMKQEAISRYLGAIDPSGEVGGLFLHCSTLKLSFFFFALR